ncbi:MAG: methyltransferase domain-containing protein [Woeseia sp.]
MTDSQQEKRGMGLDAWLQTPLGQALLQQEYRLVEEALSGVFGEFCLQLGRWGEARGLLRFARTQRTFSVSDRDGPLADQSPSLIGQPDRLPLEHDSVDAILLPHTLEFSRRPHAILREVHRVLRADGQLLILGFKPGGLWGLRRLIPGAAMPPEAETLISDRQLSDWLKLLDLHILGTRPYFFRWPLPTRRLSEAQHWEHRGRSWWPELAACYMLSAQKRVAPLTLIRKPWRAKPKVVGGLVEPSTRIRHE